MPAHQEALSSVLKEDIQSTNRNENWCNANNYGGHAYQMLSGVSQLLAWLLPEWPKVAEAAVGKRETLYSALNVNCSCHVETST